MAEKPWPPKWVRKSPRHVWHRVVHLHGNGEATEASTRCGRIVSFGMQTRYRKTAPTFADGCFTCLRSPEKETL